MGDIDYELSHKHNNTGLLGSGSCVIQIKPEPFFISSLLGVSAFDLALSA